MNRLVFKKRKELVWEEVETPKIQTTNQILVEPLAIARCDLDLPIVRGETLFRAPFPIGHEFVGRILAVSEDLESVYAKGQKVAVTFQISCGGCPSCASGFHNSCETVPYTSAYGMAPGANLFGGAISETVLVPYARDMVVPLPDDLDPIGMASFSDNISEVWKLAGRFIHRRKDPKVLVVGGGAASIGLYTALFLHQTKQAEVLYTDTDQNRIRLAELQGIPVEHFSQYGKPKERFDLVCDASASLEGWNFATRSLGKNAIFTSASIFWSNKWEIPYLEMYNQGVEIHIGRVSSLESMVNLLPYVTSRMFTPEKIVTKVSSFSDAKEAWMEESTKLVITGKNF